MVRLFSRSRRSCNPCKSEIIQATQTAVDVSAQAENKVNNLQEDVIINSGGIAANRVTAENALSQAGDALVTAQQAKQTAESISAVADNAITLATDAQSAVDAVEDELTVIIAKNAQQDTDISDLQQDYIDTDAHLTAVETDLEGHETNYNNPHRVTAAQLGLTGALTYKGQVQNYADLPTTGNNKGDTWNVVNAYSSYPAHSNVIWDGSQWDNTGGTINFSGIQNQIDTLSGTVASNKTAVDTEITGIKTLNTTQTQQITALQTGKQDKLTAGSGIAISNGVITATGYSGEVDTALSTTSTNPVTNKAITEAINGKQAAGNYALKSEVTAVASDLADAEATINGHITAADARLTNLEQSLSAVDQRVTANATKNTEQDSTLRSLQVELDGKQNILSFDTTPTAGSSKPVTSNGVYEALQSLNSDWTPYSGTTFSELFDTVELPYPSGYGTYAVYRAKKDIAVLVTWWAVREAFTVDYRYIGTAPTFFIPKGSLVSKIYVSDYTTDTGVYIISINDFQMLATTPVGVSTFKGYRVATATQLTNQANIYTILVRN